MKKRTRCRRCGKTLVNTIGKVSLLNLLECSGESCKFSVYPDDWDAEDYEWDESLRIAE